jgi:hypothetical protein
MEDTFEDFMRKQGQIYDKFRDTTNVKENGLVDGIEKSLGGFLVAFRHPNRITEPLARFAERIASVIPALPYNEGNIHTTITDYGVCPAEDFISDMPTLNKLSSAVQFALHEQVPSPTISYDNWRFNQNSVIVAGQPNKAFFQRTQGVVKSCSRQVIKVNGLWGAHITALRTTDKVDPGDLKEFYRLMKEAPELGTSTPQRIDVAYFNLTKQKFNFSVYRKFELH